MKEVVQFIKEKPKKSGKPFWNVKAGDVWYNVWEEPQFEIGVVIVFGTEQNGKFNPVMLNIRKVEDPMEIRQINCLEDHKSKSIALLACVKSVGSAAESMKISCVEELVASAKYCYKWYLDQMKTPE